jgi:excinuclease UvrABC helicase subunit UvrB
MYHDLLTQKTIEIKVSAGKRNEQVARVFGPDCTQREIFDSVRPLIEKCESGYNITVFTYGQTGSGKTYTMFGSDWNNIIKTHNH